jgi:succinate dehydrogenase / fumarate reductase flavoprotein subunit
MYLEIKAGNGINGQNYLYLDVRPETVNKYAALDGRKRPDGSPYNMTGEEITAKLPDIVDFARTYLGVDPVVQPMPVQPTAHYTMGGIPTNKYGEVVIDENNMVMPGFYAAGEVACVSVHGANRLGTNSLLDLIVFGKHSGLRAAEYALGVDFQPLPDDLTEFTVAQFDRIRNAQGDEKILDISSKMKLVMMDSVGMFRTGEGMQGALETVRELRERYLRIPLHDTGKIFNTEMINIWELGNLLEIAELVTVCALARTESRGGHYREDYPKRDDANWLKHTLSWVKPSGEVELRYKPVVITKFQPKERVY